MVRYSYIRVPGLLRMIEAGGIRVIVTIAKGAPLRITTISILVSPKRTFAVGFIPSSSNSYFFAVWVHKSSNKTVIFNGSDTYWPATATICDLSSDGKLLMDNANSYIVADDGIHPHLVLILCLTFVGVTKTYGQEHFNVLDFKAVGDGDTDDTEAFQNAWDKTCGSTGARSTMIVPADKTFLVMPTIFQGPCKPTSVHVQGLRVHQCNDTVVSGLSFADSPQTHLTIYGCQGFNVTWLNITAPQTSPNTDGIHVQASQHVKIQDTVIGTGDDCISIGDRVHDIVIERITCGPGHGVSVGSLGKGRRDVLVDEIHVSYVQMFNTTNGARIKTWQGATGSASRISFEHINVTNVKNPIVIDQYYCDSDDECPIKEKAVHISNVTFAYLTGTSKTKTAVTLNCSQTVPCTGVHLKNVNLTAVSSPNDTKVSCINVHGDTSGYVYPTIACLH
uniref:Probable polygalacturonase At3g15720 n=1 Tax=Elaeis guineensis var. tenera TaxID=51953 RepID=A0A6I9QTM3_ELAGV|nr:probable polygalacturonase At3g15720 [Elaeis guineensis]